MTYPSGRAGSHAARRYSITAVCEALGVPARDWPLFTRWAADPSPESMDTLHQYVDVMIAERCYQPGDDLVSRLIELEVDGEELSVEDIHRYVASLVTRI
ncbi:hypothetical protein [Mycolicibacterium sp. XJ1819]